MVATHSPLSNIFPTILSNNAIRTILYYIFEMNTIYFMNFKCGFQKMLEAQRTGKYTLLDIWKAKLMFYKDFNCRSVTKSVKTLMILHGRSQRDSKIEWINFKSIWRIFGISRLEYFYSYTWKIKRSTCTILLKYM